MGRGIENTVILILAEKSQCCVDHQSDSSKFGNHMIPLTEIDLSSAETGDIHDLRNNSQENHFRTRTRRGT